MIQYRVVCKLYYMQCKARGSSVDNDGYAPISAIEFIKSAKHQTCPTFSRQAYKQKALSTEASMKGNAVACLLSPSPIVQPAAPPLRRCLDKKYEYARKRNNYYIIN